MEPSALPAASATPDPALLRRLHIPAAASILLLALPFVALMWNQRWDGGVVVFLTVAAFLFLWPYGVVLFRALRGNAPGAATLGLQTSAPVALWAGLLLALITVGSAGMIARGSYREFLVDSLPMLLYLGLLLAAQVFLFRWARHLQRVLRPGPTLRAHAAGIAVMSVYVTGVLFVAGMTIPSALRPQRHVANELAAAGALRAIRTAAEDYAMSYKNGFPPSLAALGPAPAPAGAKSAPPLDCEFADLIAAHLAAGMSSGYTFTYVPGPPVKQPAPGCPPGAETYSVTARPVEFGLNGVRSFYVGTDGVIRATGENRPATASDKPIN